MIECPLQCHFLFYKGKKRKIFSVTNARHRTSHYDNVPMQSIAIFTAVKFDNFLMQKVIFFLFLLNT